MHRINLKKVIEGVRRTEPLAASLTVEHAEAMVRRGLAQAARDDGDLPPLFRRDGNFLEVTPRERPVS